LREDRHRIAAVRIVSWLHFCEVPTGSENVCLVAEPR
jgi:hypothetical protein